MRGAAIALIGVGVFWVGGFFLLTRGEDWPEIEAAVLTDPGVISLVGGSVYRVRADFLGYSYGFRGDSGYAAFTATVESDISRRKMHLILKREAGHWMLADSQPK